MGFAPLPYMVTNDLLEVEYLISWERYFCNNVFQWLRVVLDLRGMKRYQPSRPWVYKIRVDEKLANDLFFYIDDGRSTVFSAKEGWRALRSIGRMIGFLRIQDANRKRTIPSMTSGEWDGTSTNGLNDSTTGLVSVKKWKKGQNIIYRIQEELERKGRFKSQGVRAWYRVLIYLSRTYRMMIPYLKGAHQTLDSWRPVQMTFLR